MTKSKKSTPSPIGREKLLDAAIRLFGKEGYEGTFLRAVAEEAGVSLGLTRFYFGSKEGLLNAAEERVVNAYLDRVVAGSVSNIEEISKAIEESADLPLTARFLRRCILEDRPIVLDFLSKLTSMDGDIVASLYADFPQESWLNDPIRNVVTRLGYLLLAPQLIQLLDRDVFSTEELKLRNRQTFRIFELVRLGLEYEQMRQEAAAKPKRTKSS